MAAGEQDPPGKDQPKLAAGRPDQASMPPDMVQEHRVGW
jgi:hypothetical protein